MFEKVIFKKKIQYWDSLDVHQSLVAHVDTNPAQCWFESGNS